MAGRLPFHILVDVFFAARDGNEVEAFDHGGRLTNLKWDSMESAATLTLVCKAWKDAAVFALHRSISILGGEAASIFLDTLRAHPERAAFTRSMVCGLDFADERACETERALRSSAKVLQALEACPLISHLQIRPLHPSLRLRVVDAIRTKPLTALVYLPRFDTPVLPPHREMDLRDLVGPKLEGLEVELWADSAAPIPSSTPSSILLHSTFPPLALRDLRVFCPGADGLVLALVSAAGNTLHSLDVYIETVYKDPSVVASALLPSAHTLQRLKYLTCPSLADLAEFYDPKAPQVFDLVLPHLTKLVELVISATEVSPEVFRSIDFRLEEVDLHDEAWRPQDVRELGAALARRGTTLHYTPD
ncbi:hypothetical protein RQP46_009830 [Phenoliferia psychrophenolica]